MKKYCINEKDLDEIKNHAGTAQGFITAAGMLIIPDHNKHVIDLAIKSISDIIDIIEAKEVKEVEKN